MEIGKNQTLFFFSYYKISYFAVEYNDLLADTIHAVPTFYFPPFVLFPIIHSSNFSMMYLPLCFCKLRGKLTKIRAKDA